MFAKAKAPAEEKIEKHFDLLIGESPVMKELYKLISRVSKTSANVMLLGESGVGKESIPKIIHALSHRKHGKYIAVNCGAIPPELVESELFGHLKGSFTGAMYDKQGLFQAAEGGTLLLDEVADLSQVLQAAAGLFIKADRADVVKSVLLIEVLKGIVVGDVGLIDILERSFQLYPYFYDPANQSLEILAVAMCVIRVV